MKLLLRFASFLFRRIRGSRKRATRKLVGTLLVAFFVRTRFRQRPTALGSVATSHRRVFFLGWMSFQNSPIISGLEACGISISKLDFFRFSIDSREYRNLLGKIARAFPAQYFAACERYLASIDVEFPVLLTTHDWPTPLRLFVRAASRTGVPSLTWLHEGVWFEQRRFYRDSITQVSTPVSNVCLVWDHQARDIFARRGFPAGRLRAVGSMKLLEARNRVLDKSVDQIRNELGLEPGHKVITFAFQTLDNIGRIQPARSEQMDWCLDTVRHCRQLGIQVLVRLPPSEIYGTLEIQRLLAFDNCVVDAVPYSASVLETLEVSDLVLAMGSTVLLEAKARGVASMRLSSDYWKSDSELMEKIPRVEDGEHLRQVVHEVLDQRGTVEDGRGRFFAADDSIPYLRPHAVMQALEDCVEVSPATPVERFVSGERIDVAGVPFQPELLSSVYSNLSTLLNVNSLVSTVDLPKKSELASGVELFCQWGGKPTRQKAEQLHFASALGVSRILLEDGFFRSVGLGAQGEPGFSIVWDDANFYYNTVGETPSRLARTLQEERASQADLSRAGDLIELIDFLGLSKYNFAMGRTIDSRSGKPKILIVDQRRGDQSIIGGGGSSRSFQNLIETAHEISSSTEILVKVHPDKTRAGFDGAITNEALEGLKRARSNIFLLDQDIDSAALLKMVDEVWVVTSGMGFEAGIRGIPVRCFARPFYSGWGLTNDTVSIGRSQLSIGWRELAFRILISQSVYVSPTRGKRTEPEEFLQELAWQASQAQNIFKLDLEDFRL